MQIWLNVAGHKLCLLKFLYKSAENGASMSCRLFLMDTVTAERTDVWTLVRVVCPSDL